MGYGHGGGLSGGWVWVQDAPVLQLPLIAATVTAAWRAYLRAAPASEVEARSAGARWLVRVPLGLFAGWITLASVAASTEVLIALDVKPPVGNPDVWALAALTGLSAGTVAVASRRPVSRAFPLVVAWGLAAVAARNLPTQRLAGTTAALGAAAVAVAGLISGRRRRTGA